MENNEINEGQNEIVKTEDSNEANGNKNDKKNFGGFLRKPGQKRRKKNKDGRDFNKNQGQTQTQGQNGGSQHRHKPRANSLPFQIDITDYELEHDPAYASNPHSPEFDLFSSIRQKSGFNESKFFADLEAVLKNKRFADVSFNDNTLLSYSVLYPKETVFEKLLERFGNEVGKDEYEKNLFAYCMNKPVFFLTKSLEAYSALHLVSSEIIDSIIDKATKSSHQSDVNSTLLSWLVDKADERQMKRLVEDSISNRNVSLYDQILKNGHYADFVKSAYAEKAEAVSHMCRKHATERTIGLTPVETTVDEHRQDDSKPRNPDVVVKKRRRIA